MRELHLFAGAGGGILGGILLGHTCVCAVELEPYCRNVLLQRQRDGILPRFPIWDDVRTFDGKPWRGRVDVVCGGFPCQDISAAGKGAGITGERSGLWSEMARVIGEVRPRYAFVENSPMLTVRGLGTVLRDLAAMGYDARWGIVSAANAGAPHKRERIWILADAGQERRTCREIHPGNVIPTLSIRAPDSPIAEGERRTDVPDADSPGRKEQRRPFADANVANSEMSGQSRSTNRQGEMQSGGGCSWWRVDPAEQKCSAESKLGRVVDGVANRVDRLLCIGNGQVPAVAALAWRMLMPLDAGPAIE